MNFTIVLASRERSQLLVGLTKSIQDNTADLSNIEVIIAIDNDDAESQDARVHITGWYSWVRFISRDRTKMLNRDYLNWAASMGTGKYIIICNDDAAFVTKNWDQIALRKLDSYLSDKPDGIVYAYISDALINRQGMNYCCFPLISRRAFEALGFAMPPEYPAWGADITLWQLFMNVGRVYDLSEIMIEHIAYHSGKRNRDHISHYVQSISNHCAINVPFEEYVNRLRRAIR